MKNKEYYANGQKIFETNGDCRTYFYKNGTLKAEGVMKDDLMEGEWKFYRETGQLWQIGLLNTTKKTVLGFGMIEIIW